MIRFEIIATFLVLFSLQLKAQDFPYHYFSQVNPMVNNPSFAANDAKLNVHVASYNLWAGGFKPLNDYLISFSVSRDNRKNRKRTLYQSRVGFGAALLHENIGPFMQDILQLIYAYHISLSRKTSLLFGISGLIENMGIDINSLTPSQTDDPRLLNSNNSSSLFDGGFGATIKSTNYKVCFSVLNMAPSVFKFKSNAAENIKEYRKFFLGADYLLKLSNKSLFSPGISFRNTFQNKLGFDSVFDFDLNNFSFGGGYRSEQTVFLFTKVRAKNFVLSYTSENPLKSNHMIGFGHTVSLSWSFD